MKTTFILAVFLYSYSVAFTQDSHQAPSGMTFSQRQLVDTNQQTKFIYSWNWLDGPQALNSRYKMNAFHTFDVFNNGWSVPSQPTSYNTMPDSLRFMWSVFYISSEDTALDAIAII